MKIQETITFLRWLCEHEYRIQYSDAAVEVWAYSLRSVEPSVAKQAVLEHYKANESVVATPGGIAKRAANIATSREAGNRAIALEPAHPVAHPLSWRRRNPELWDELFEQGRIEANEERRQATAARTRAREPDTSGWMAA